MIEIEEKSEHYFKKSKLGLWKVVICYRVWTRKVETYQKGAVYYL